MSSWRTFRRLLVLVTSAVVSLSGAAIAAENEYGPVNLLKTMATPFGSTVRQTDETQSSLAPMSLSTSGRSVINRLLVPRLYLPGRMVIGSTAEFIIKGRPGYWAALAMADKCTGAKPIYGHDLHLGADRKLVSLGKIPESGVLALVIETPIQGDQIGEPWYFEAAVWSKPDFSDVEIALPTASELSPATAKLEHPNGVLVVGETVHKRGIRFVPDTQVPSVIMPGKAQIDSGRI